MEDFIRNIPLFVIQNSYQEFVMNEMPNQLEFSSIFQTAKQFEICKGSTFPLDIKMYINQHTIHLTHSPKIGWE